MVELSEGKDEKTSEDYDEINHDYDSSKNGDGDIGCANIS